MKDIIDVFKNLKKHLMTGIGYVIPVICAGGICCGVGVLIGGTSPWEAPGTAGYFFFMLGKYGLNLMPAVIAAFVAFSIGDKAAIAPGLIVGQVAQDTGAGFIGGLLAGIFLGILVKLMRTVKVPKTLSGLWDIILIPLVTTVIGAYLMEGVIGGAITAFNNWLTVFADGLGTENLVLLALIMGFFASLDLGLFCSKAFSPFILALLATTDPETGLPIMIGQRLNLTLITACCVPPLVVAFSTFIMPKRFNKAEKQSGISALFLGLCGITEGAIPLATTHISVYAGCIAGAMAGAVAQILLGAGTIINWPGLPHTPGTTGVFQSIIAHAIGVAVGVLVVFLFMGKEKQPVEEEKEAVVSKEGDEINLDF